MVSKLDSFLLEKIEKFAQKTERITGWSCFWLARICSAYVVMFGLWKINEEGVSFWNILLIAGWSLVYFLYIPIMEKQCYDAQKKGGSNPIKASNLLGFFRRINVLLLVFLFISSLILLISIPAPSPELSELQIYLEAFDFLVICLFFYFISCDPLKPGEEKQKEKIPDGKPA